MSHKLSAPKSILILASSPLVSMPLADEISANPRTRNITVHLPLNRAEALATITANRPDRVVIFRTLGSDKPEGYEVAEQLVREHGYKPDQIYMMDASGGRNVSGFNRIAIPINPETFARIVTKPQKRISQ